METYRVTGRRKVEERVVETPVSPIVSSVSDHTGPLRNLLPCSHLLFCYLKKMVLYMLSRNLKPLLQAAS